MKASLKWIKELLPELKASANVVAKRLTASGIEVEAVESENALLPGIITAEVRAVEKHPQADKLSVCTVFDGEMERTVVCGAPNVRAGLKVAFAPVGVTLPGGLQLERREIRGVLSEGMICSESELGLSDEDEGIMELKPRMRPGKRLVESLKMNDTRYELGVTPNRPDVLSHIGLARDLAAVYGLSLPKVSVRVREVVRPAATFVKIDIRSGKRCAKYIGRVLTGIKVGPSPKDVQHRLRGVGVRPISNVVDATNLVLMELGQPLHAFDLDRIHGSKILVRLAKEDEEIELLDGSQKKLTKDDLVIADAEKPVALAGVMGGANSEVGDETTNVLLEAAVFDPGSVRRTARRYALHTEASHRFERGIDPDMVETAIDRCAQLIVEWAGGQVHKGRISVVKREPEEKLVSIRPERASGLIGRTVERAEVRTALTALGLKSVKRPKPTGKKVKKKTKAGTNDALTFRIPTWRVDLNREEDLIEEVARLKGYDEIPALMPARSQAVWRSRPDPDPESDVRHALVGHGFLEAISLAFNARRQLDAFQLDAASAVVVANPLGEESQYMRMSMLPALMKAARLNQDQLPSTTDLRLFEIGRTFVWADPSAPIPEQGRRVGILMRGRRFGTSWSTPEDMLDAYDLKGAIETIFDAYGIVKARWERFDTAWLHPRSGTKVAVADRDVGVMGEAHPDLMAQFGLSGPPVFLAELDVDGLNAFRGADARFKPLAKLPPAQRDLSFFIDEATEAASILDTVHGADDAGLLESVQIFDIYTGRGVPEGKKSLAVAMVFRSSDRTLTDKEIESVQAGIVGALEGLGAQIRSA